jgi:hypothetical protein
MRVYGVPCCSRRSDISKPSTCVNTTSHTFHTASPGDSAGRSRFACRAGKVEDVSSTCICSQLTLVARKKDRYTLAPIKAGTPAFYFHRRRNDLPLGIPNQSAHPASGNDVATRRAWKQRFPVFILLRRLRNARTVEAI